jgi:hypothetical protein
MLDSLRKIPAFFLALESAPDDCIYATVRGILAFHSETNDLYRIFVSRDQWTTTDFRPDFRGKTRIGAAENAKAPHVSMRGFRYGEKAGRF